MFTFTRSQALAFAALIILTGAFAFLVGRTWDATYVPTFWTNVAMASGVTAYVVAWFASLIHVVERPGTR